MKKLTVFLTFFLFSSIALASSTAKNNKEFVIDFYTEVFFKAQPEKLDEYIGDQYIQHNPMLPDGKEAIRAYVSNYLVPIVKAGGTIGEIVRVIAEDDLVVVHVNFAHYPSEKGGAVMDIFRIENGKIVEHWDVVQEIPEGSANDNGMF